MRPLKRITDPTFRYYPSVDTDLKRTFERVRREQAALKSPVVPVTPIRRTAKGVTPS